MSHDFAKSRRPAPAAPKKKKIAASVPGWLSMLLGTLAGALVMYLVYISGYAPPLPDRKAAEQPVTAPVDKPAESKAKSTKEPPAPPKRTSPVFEFYTKLPASGAPTVDSAALPDAQPPPMPPAPAADMDPIQQLLAQQESQRQELQRQEAQKKQAGADAASSSGSAMPDVTSVPDVTGVPDANANPSESHSPATQAQAVAVKPAGEKPAVTAASPEPVAKPGSRYALQAGAFRKRSEADTLRAKLLLLGVKASIQPVTNAKGESMHRVIAGPFASADEMEDAKIILGGNHISTIPVK